MAEFGLERIVVVRALKGLGDFLCVVPALRALRSAYPQAHIALLGHPSSQSLVDRFSHYIDELLPFPGFPGIPEAPVDVTRLPGFFAEAQARGFDLALQMHGNGSLTNPFTALLGAKATAGYYAPGAYCPDPQRCLPLDESTHEVRRWLRLLEHNGIPAAGEHLEFPVQDADFAALRALPDAAKLEANGYVVVHPGATEPLRRWSPEYFAAVGDYFARDGRRVVLTGTREEVELAADVAARMRYNSLNLAGKTSLGALAALLCNAGVLVSNDTGVSHLAAALGIPSVVIFLASDPERWAPLDAVRHRIVGANGLTPEQVGPDAVLREAYALLRDTAPAAGSANVRGAHRAAAAKAAAHA